MTTKPNARSVASAAGWTPERRARQARLIYRWKPWTKTTGPKSVSGKSRSKMNALKTGARSAVMRRLSRLLALINNLQEKEVGK